jgi:hypothetical protein
MKTNQMTALQKVRGAGVGLLLGLLVVQTARACWTLVPSPCVGDSVVNYDCNSESSDYNGTQSITITDGTIFNDLEATNTGASGYTNIPKACSWTVEWAYCDGSESDFPGTDKNSNDTGLVGSCH